MKINNAVPRNWNDELRSCVLSIPADEDRNRLIRAIQGELFDRNNRLYKNTGEWEDSVWWQGRNESINEFLKICIELKNSHLGGSTYMEGYQNAIFDIVAKIKEANLNK